MGIRMAETPFSCPSGVSFEQKLFRSFFDDVAGCRQLMKEKQVFAFGGAVLHALIQRPGWEPGNLDLVVSRSSIDDRGFSLWHGYFREQGYILQRETHDAGYVNGYVSLKS